MPGQDPGSAELLAFDTPDSFTLAGDPNGEVFYYLEPDVTGSYRFKLDGDTSGDHPYCDVYRLTEGSLAAFSYSTWVGWCSDASVQSSESCVELVAGATYVVAVYDWSFGASSMSATIEVEEDVGPANDRVANAELVAGGVGVEVVGTTAGGSQEEDEFNDHSGSQAPSVWYKVVIGGPGVFSYGIESTTPGFNPNVDLFWAASPPSSFSDLDYDISAEYVGDGTQTPNPRLYDQSGTPGSSAGDLAPLEGGEVFYLRISSDDDNDASDFGGFVLTVSSPPEAMCLDAVDYISGSGTVSVASGAVRETQAYNGGFVAATTGHEAWLTDMTPTLVIPGEDILDGAGAGFYAVSVKTKLAENASPQGGMRRNGQNLYPGSFIDSTTGSTPVTSWLTMPAGTDPYQEVRDNDIPSGFVNSLNMVWYLPVKAGDEIEIILVGNGEEAGSSTIDVTQVCFQRMLDAQDGVAYATLDVPEYPLGMVAGDAATATGKQGPWAAALGAGSAPTFNNHDIEGMDLCVTDDGTLWALVEMEASTTSGTRFIGPALLKWNGSSWDVVNNDIEGLGVKRTTRGGVAGSNGPYGVSIDTDGEDLWVAYGVDDGAGPGGFRHTACRVKKYDVSADSFSNVGGLVCANTTRVSVRAEVGGFESSVHLKVSPGGTPWIAFCDWYDEGKSSSAPGPDPPLYLDTPRPAYVAKFNGSSWDVTRLPPPEWWQGDHTDAEADTITHQAESIQVGGGSGSILSQTTVTTTQTTYVDDHLAVTPPAGRYAIWYRVAASSNSNTACRVRIDGADIAFSDDIAVSAVATAFTVGKSDFYVELDGTEELRLSFRRTSGTGTIHIDKIYLVPDWVMVQNSPNSWGPWYVPFVEDGQFHVQLAFPDGENPVAIYTTASLRYTDDPDDVAFNEADPWDVGYVPPETHWGNYAYLFQLVVYSRYDGADWERLWQSPLDRDLPNYFSAKTPYEPFGGPTPLGVFQQGLSLHTDGTDVWAAMCCGLDINGGAEFVLFKCGEESPEYVGERPPGILGGNGYADFGFSWLQWGWDIHPKSVLKTDDGLFVGFPHSGVPDDYSDIVAVYAPNGIGDWFMAGKTHMEMGYSALDIATTVLVQSPDGSKIYIGSILYKGDLAGIPDPDTSGVWECDVNPADKVPLIPVELAGDVNMNKRWQGDRGPSGIRRYHR